MEKTKKIKLFIGLSYLALIIVFLFLFFSKFSLQELTSYEFIIENRLYFSNLKSSNLFLISTIPPVTLIPSPTVSSIVLFQRVAEPI